MYETESPAQPAAGYVTGHGQSREVWWGQEGLHPRKSLAVYNHSPDGFAWGYGGSGPAQLALAILLRATNPDGNGDRRIATALYEAKGTLQGYTLAQFYGPDSEPDLCPCMGAITNEGRCLNCGKFICD